MQLQKVFHMHAGCIVHALAHVVWCVCVIAHADEGRRVCVCVFICV